MHDRKMTKNTTIQSNNSTSSLANSTGNINNSNNNTNSNSNYTRKPRRSIKAEGNCLTAMLREGRAKVIDASKLGKRLSSEIWNSFGAIQVEDSFVNPSISTRVVADGLSSMKICQLFVACSKCFSVFKYDGHAYGTTGLVKHVKICQGLHHRDPKKGPKNITQNPIGNDLDNTHNTQTSVPNTSCSITNSINSNNNSTLITNSLGNPIACSSILDNCGANNSTSTTNGPVTPTRKRDTSSSSKTRTNPTGIRYLTKLVEETRCDLADLKQKMNDLINLMSGTSYVGQIQIISNDGEKVDDELQKAD